MVMASSSILMFLAVLLLPALSWKLLKWVWLKPRKLEKMLRTQGFRGNPYRLLVGDVKDVSKLLKEAHSKPILISDDIVPRIIPELLQIIKKHGKKSYVWFGPEPAVIIHDFDLMKEASQCISQFHKPEATQFTRLLMPGLVSYNGEKWTKHRKLINPVFHGEKLKHMLPSFITSAKGMLKKWEEICVSQKGPCELDVWPDLHSLTSDAISRTAFGSNYEEGKMIFELQRELGEHCVKALWSMFIPGWRFLPTKRNRRMKKLAKDVGDLIRAIIDLRMNAMERGDSSGDNDLLGILLQSNSQEIIRQGKKDSGMTIDEVIEECKLFHVAGQESTSVLLVWTMVLLSRYPDWQARASDEVLQLFGNNEPHLDGLNRLKIVTMILYEVLRLYPPVPVNGRITAEETKLGNLALPARMQLLLPTILVHHDPEIWGVDAKEFKPERFSEGIMTATKGKGAFLPFGWGPRVCVGQSFAMLEAKVMMVMILQRFRFELSPSYSHAPISLITLKPEHGAHLILYEL